MFKLPETTDIRKIITKKAIYENLKLNSKDKKLFEDQVAKISIVTEISPHTVNIAFTEQDAFIYILLIHLKTEDCDRRIIELLSKVIHQRVLFALQYMDKIIFAVKRADKVLFSGTKPEQHWELKLEGLNLSYIWNQLIISIFDIQIYRGKTIDESILLNEKRNRLHEQIERLDKKSRIEKQPRRKRELVDEIRKLQKQLEEIGYE